MSKLLLNLAALNAKALVNAYTWTTLPFYTVAQRPWTKLRLAKTLGVIKTTDKQGRTVYSRPSPPTLSHPFYKYKTFPEIFSLLDRNREAVGVREVISEQAAFDENGNPVKVDGKVLKKVKLGDFKWKTAGQVMDRVDALARGLKQLGVQPGDKVMIYADNSVEWLYCCLALSRINAVTVTLFSTLGESGVLHGYNNSDAKYTFVSQNLLGNLNKLADQFEHLKKIVYIRSEKGDATEVVEQLTAKNFEVCSFDQLESTGAKLPECVFEPPKPEDNLLIMYTSGTTGDPKGVVITHEQFCQTLLNLLRYDEENGFIVFNSTYCAYLPMGHVFGYMMNIGMFLSDSKVAFCNPLTLLDSSPAHVKGQVGDLKMIKPEFLVSVPLVLERILKEIHRKLDSVSPIAQPVFTYLMDYKIRWTSRGYNTPIINRLVCKRVRDQFGGRLRLMVVSSAPLNERTHALIQAALDCKVVIAYGSTEMTGTSHVLPLNDMSYGTTGVPWHNFSFYLKPWEEGGYSPDDLPNPRGEVVVSSVCVANGYYKMPKETAESFKTDSDGKRWLETGDIGEVLPNGTLKIIDRKKDLTKLANGEFVSLGKIESSLRNSPYVENVCVCTDRYSNVVTAVISPNPRALLELGQRLAKSNLTFEQLCDDPQVNRSVLDSLKVLATKELGLKLREVPVAITLSPIEWSPDNNLITAAMKMKRKQVNDFYRPQIKQMFEQLSQQAASEPAVTPNVAQS